MQQGRAAMVPPVFLKEILTNVLVLMGLLEVHVPLTLMNVPKILACMDGVSTLLDPTGIKQFFSLLTFSFLCFNLYLIYLF